MTRQEAIAAVFHMLRPLGPYGEPADREHEEAAWAKRAAGDARMMSALIDLVRTPPDAAEQGRAVDGELQSQLAHVLGLSGAHAPATVLDQIGPLTQDACARVVAIEVIGAIGDAAGLRWLAPLVEVDLSDEEATWLACSLGEIGTAEAGLLLERLASRAVSECAKVGREIQIARDAIARRGA